MNRVQLEGKTSSSVSICRPTRLGDIAEITMGNSPPGNSYNENGEGVPLINGPVEFSDGAFGNTKLLKYTTAPTKMCKAGDLLICVRGATTGRTNIAAFDACIGRGVASIRVTEHQPYVNHFIRSVREQVLASGNGSTFPSISQGMLSDLVVPLPPLAEQKRIAAILDQADAIRCNRRQALETTADLIPAIFHEMFGDVAVNSRNYPTKTLSDVATLDRGKSRHRPRNATHLYGGPYPFIQTGDIANSDGRVSKYSQTYSEDGLSQSRMWPAGTLCITIAANIAETAILTFDACFPDSVVGLVPSKDLNVEYVQGYFSAMQQRLEDTATQVAQKNINLALLRNLPIPIPALHLQSEFAQAVARVREHRDRQTIYQRETERLFHSLVQQAFRGEL